MTLRDVTYALVLLGCGFVVGYFTGVDRAAPLPAPEIAAPSAAPAPAGAAPPVAETATVARTDEVAAAAAAKPTDAAAAAKPTDAVAAPADAAAAKPTGTRPGEWVTPPHLLDPATAKLPDTVRSRLPNTPHSLKGIPILGDVFTAPVTITIFGDLQCRFTADGLAQLERAISRHPGKLAVGFRHFPTEQHEWAMGAARAAWAANEQGKFWEFTRKALAHLDDLSEPALRAIAGELGLDLERFDRDRKGDPASWQIEADLAVGRSIEVDGTPTLLINGRRFSGLPDDAAFDLVIQQSIGEVDQLRFKGADLIQARGKACDRAALRMPLKSRKGASLDELRRIPLLDAPRRGAEDPLVGVVVFSDFQCQPCAQAARTLEKALAAHTDVAVSFRQFPMSMHEHARDAAIAALFAADFGKFWELHDRLFASQDALDRPSLLGHAKAVGLDPDLLDKALRTDTLRPDLERDQLLGMLLGVSSTPSVFVNGRLLPNGSPRPEDLDKAIADARTQAAEVMKAHDLKRQGFYAELMNLVEPN